MKIFGNLSLKIQQIITKGPVREGGRNPYVDWTMILIVFVIMVIASVVNGYYLFVNVSNGDIQAKVVTKPKPIEIFDVSGLNYIIDKFDSKSDTTSNVKRSYQATPDPSI